MVSCPAALPPGLRHHYERRRLRCLYHCHPRPGERRL